jgi:alpha-mannosidase
MPTSQLLILVNNHFDPTWRRAWEQRFSFRGQTFISYADIEEYYMLDNLALAATHPEYKFQAEFPLVVQKFLERHPEHLADLLALSRAGRFAVSGGGQVIVDGNMILGESLVRNYLIGLRYVENLFKKHTPLAVRNDAFGNPAQLPQVLRGCEIDWVSGLSYSVPHGNFWRGLDGSTVVCQTLPFACRAGGVFKYPPCPDCAGTGGDGSCSRCKGRGIDSSLRAYLPDRLDLHDDEELGAQLVSVAPEELLPNPALLDWAREHQARFILETEAFPYLEPWFELLDSPPTDQLHPDVELNPNNTGVFVTRIRTKQAVRRLEHDLLAAEVLGTLAWRAGRPYPQAETTQTWQLLLFCMFHDSITATHVDASYAELEGMWAEVEQSISKLCSGAFDQLSRPDPRVLSVFNPTAWATSQLSRAVLPAGSGLLDPQGHPVPLLSAQPAGGGELMVEFAAQNVPAFGAKEYTITPAVAPDPIQSEPPSARQVIENDRFRIEAGLNGVEKVVDKRLKRVILQKAEYHPAELILEHDEGSPWATLHPDQSRTPLGDSTTLLRVERGPAMQKLVYQVDTPFRAGFVANGCAATVEIKLVDGLDRIDFHLTVDWDTFNHRLRIAFPTPINGQPFYEVPFGIQERQPYPPRFDWTGANGDWPALHWGGISSTDAGVAVFNRGLPSYRIDPGLVLVSLLRSPAVPTYLHEPEYYTMTEYDGMRDPGRHTFDLAVAAYEGSLLQSPVVAEAAAFNSGLLTLPGRLELPVLPRIESDCAQICAVNPTEAGDALLIRLYECRGTGGPVRIHLPEGYPLVKTANLLERQCTKLKVKDGAATVNLRPWEILTLIVEVP